MNGSFQKCDITPPSSGERHTAHSTLRRNHFNPFWELDDDAEVNVSPHMAESVSGSVELPPVSGYTFDGSADLEATRAFVWGEQNIAVLATMRSLPAVQCPVLRNLGIGSSSTNLDEIESCSFEQEQSCRLLFKPQRSPG